MATLVSIGAVYRMLIAVSPGSWVPEDTGNELHFTDIEDGMLVFPIRDTAAS